MTGKLFVDGKDAYTNYSIFITEGGYEGVVVFPPLKKVDTNDWAEEDGVDADLSSPALDSREFSTKFISHNEVRTGAFIELISDKAYHTFDLREIGKTYKLRLVSQPDLNAIRRMEVFSLQFADDFPLEGYNYLAPKSGIVPTTGYELDNVDFANYGVRILQESLDDILKSPAVKKNLLRNIGRQHGVIYDGELVVFQTKDVKLNCLMRANTMVEFWRNYNALLFDLVRPNERIMYVENTGYEYPCYYKSSTVTEFFPVDKIWFKFSLTMIFTSFRVGDNEYLLSNEDGEWIVTEDGEYAIDLGEIEI